MARHERRVCMWDEAGGWLVTQSGQRRQFYILCSDWAIIEFGWVGGCIYDGRGEYVGKLVIDSEW